MKKTQKHISELKNTLRVAACNGDIELLKSAIASGVDINDTSTFSRRTALMIAVSNEQIECINILLENGANPNIPDMYGMTPIHFAVTKNSPDIIEMLVLAGANKDVLTNEGSGIQWTPLIRAIKCQSVDAAIKLIELGCDLKIVVPDRSCALSESIAADTREITLLIQAALAARGLQETIAAAMLPKVARDEPPIPRKRGSGVF